MKDLDATKNYFCIPEKVLLDFSLSANEIRLYGIIEKKYREKNDAMFNLDELANDFKMSRRFLNTMISRLKDRNYISTEYNRMLKKNIFVPLVDVVIQGEG